jgi:tripartite-type tricarboxylate transporter receptor subunit TctC
MGGQVMMAFDGVAGAMPAIRSGKVNLLAVTSTKRAAFWPDKPSAAEFVPGYDSGGWFGFVAPAGIPRDIAVKLNAEINRAMNAPEVVEKMANSGMVVANESVQYFEELIKHDYAKYGKLVRDIGFKPQ